MAAATERTALNLLMQRRDAAFWAVRAAQSRAEIGRLGKEHCRLLHGVWNEQAPHWLQADGGAITLTDDNEHQITCTQSACNLRLLVRSAVDSPLWIEDVRLPERGSWTGPTHTETEHPSGRSNKDVLFSLDGSALHGHFPYLLELTARNNTSARRLFVRIVKAPPATE